MRMHDDRESEIGRQSFGDRVPRLSVVVAAQHADVRTRASRSLPLTPAAVVLHIKPARCVVVARDLVHALAKLGIWIGLKTGADAFVRRRKGLASVLAHVMPARGDAEMHALAVADDGVHA